MTPASNNSGIPALKLLLALVPLAIVILVWFSPYEYHAVMGDDLNAMVLSQNGEFASSFSTAFLHAPMNKYRPLADMAFHAEILMFGKEMLRYIHWNLFLEVVNAALLAFVCWRVSGRKLSVALLGGVLFGVSRFSYYNILQIFGGALEGLALFFVLGQICAVVLAYQTKQVRYLLLAVATYACALFTHERFMVMGAFIVFSIVLAPVDYKRSYDRYLLACLPVLILLTNFAIKVFWLKSRFFEGGGGTAISFDLRKFLKFFVDGVETICGFNIGPQYLSGIDMHETGFWGIALGAAFSACIVALIWFTRAWRKKGVVTAKVLFLFGALWVPLLAAASITIRQEFRWLYAPYAVLVITICYFLGRLESKRIRALFLFVILLSALNIETFYRTYNENIYFFPALRTAQTARVKVIDDMVMHPGKSFYIFKASNTVKTWIFQGDDFFKYYSGNPKAHVSYIDDISSIPSDEFSSGKVSVYAIDEYREVVDVTKNARVFLENNK
jgi:hypothetical protein